MTGRLTRRELAWVLVWAVFVMLLTCVPYVYGQRLAAGRTFGGIVWGVDEGNAYLTWMRQAAEGDWLLRNQYAPAPETPRFLNLYLQLGGRLSGLLHLRPLVLFHALRLLCGVCLLVCFYLVAAELTADRAARWAALTLASLGSGCGWLVVLKCPGSGLHPVDVGQGWQVQPEAVTFPSLLLNGLFVASMALVCVVFVFAIRVLRDGDRRATLWGGLCLLLLGNIHTYDVFPIWLALLVWAARCGYCAPGGGGLARGPLRCLLGPGAALRRLAPMVLLGLPAVLWALYASFSDPAFLAKGLTRTPAFRLADYVVAYGLIGLLALVGAMVTHWRLNATDRGQGSGTAAQSLPLAWAAGIAIALLLPVSFQRKMIEGLHLPLCLLAGLAVSWLASAMTAGLRRRGKHKQAMERVVLMICAVVVFTLPSNALFVSQCMQAVKTNNEQLLNVLQPPIYLEAPVAAAMGWLGANSRRDDLIVSSSLMGSYLPTYSPAKVWVGHWAETLALQEDDRYVGPQEPVTAWQGVRGDGSGPVRQLGFQDQLRALDVAFAPVAAETLLGQLRAMHATVVFYSPWEQAITGGASSLPQPPPDYVPRWLAAADKALQKVYDEGGVRIYRVPPAQQESK